MEKAHVGIETDCQPGQRAVFGQHAVGEGKHGVDRVGRGTTVAVGKVEVKGELSLTLGRSRRPIALAPDPSLIGPVLRSITAEGGWARRTVALFTGLLGV